MHLHQRDAPVVTEEPFVTSGSASQAIRFAVLIVDDQNLLLRGPEAESDVVRGLVRAQIFKVGMEGGRVCLGRFPDSGTMSHLVCIGHCRGLGWSCSGLLH